MSNIPHLPPGELVCQTVSSASGCKALLCPEQKIIFRIKNTIHKFTLPSGLVVDCCAGTFSVSKTFLLQLQHGRFDRYELN